MPQDWLSQPLRNGRELEQRARIEERGGIATDAMNAVRIQSIGVDQMMTRITDAMLLRRKARVTTVPGETDQSGVVQEDEAS